MGKEGLEGGMGHPSFANRSPPLRIAFIMTYIFYLKLQHNIQETKHMSVNQDKTVRHKIQIIYNSLTSRSVVLTTTSVHTLPWLHSPTTPPHPRTHTHLSQSIAINLCRHSIKCLSQQSPDSRLHPINILLKNLQLHELNFRENYRHPRESNVGFSAQIK